MWFALGAAGLNAVLQGQAAKRRNEQMKSQNMAAAEQTRYSPWSGMGGGQINTNYEDPNMKARAGGIQGAAAAQGLQKGFNEINAAPKAEMPSFGGGSMLGGQEMAQQMGQDYQSPWFQMSPPNSFAGR